MFAPASHAARIRAFSTGISSLGHVPTRRIFLAKSKSSINAVPAYAALLPIGSLAPSILHSHSPSSEFTSFDNACMASTGARSPASAATLPFFSAAPAIASASGHSAGCSLPFLRM